MALNLLKQLRSIEETGKLPKDTELPFDSTQEKKQHKSPIQKAQLHNKLQKQQRSRAQSMHSVDSESKDGMNPQGISTIAPVTAMHMTREDILRIVDDPYSNNSTAHLEHTLSSDLLKQLLNSRIHQHNSSSYDNSSEASRRQSEAPSPFEGGDRHDAADDAYSVHSQLSINSLNSASISQLNGHGQGALNALDRSIDRNRGIVERNMMSLMDGTGSHSNSSRRGQKKPSKSKSKHNYDDEIPHQMQLGKSFNDIPELGEVQGDMFTALLEREYKKSGGIKIAVDGPSARESYIQGLQMYSVTAPQSVSAGFDEENSIHSLLSVNSQDSTTKAIVKAQIEQEHYEKEMMAKKLRIASSMYKNQAIIDKNIGISVDFLPTELLIKYGKFELVKERALTKMWNLLCKMRLALLFMGIRQWVTFLRSTNESIRLGAGAEIVRIARGFLGRQKGRARRAIWEEAERKKGRLNKVKGMGVLPRVILIQSAIRRMRSRVRVKPMLKAHRAATFVQIFIKQRLLIIISKRAVQRMKMQRYMAGIIQKHFRAWRGRKRFRQARKEWSHAITKAKYETTDSMFQWYFEQNGAAAKLQHWFRNMPWYVKAKFTRKYLPFYKQRKAIWMDTTGRLGKRKAKKKKKKKFGGNAKDKEYNDMANKRVSQNEKMTDIAEFINQLVRGFLSRRRVSNMRKEMKRIKDLREHCVLLLQKTIRRVLVAMRMPHIGTRIRSSKIKYRRWCSSNNFRLKLETEAYAIAVEAQRLQEEEEARLQEMSRGRPGSRGFSRGGTSNRGGSAMSMSNMRAITPLKFGSSSRVGSSSSTAGKTTDILTPRSSNSRADQSRPNSKNMHSGSKQRPLVKWWNDEDQHIYVPPTVPLTFATGEAKIRARMRTMEDVISTPSDPLLPLHLSLRRNSIDIGVHFKMLKAKELPYMDNASHVISRAFRSAKSRKKFAEFMANKKQVYATKLQNWGLFMTLRRRIFRFRHLIVEELGLWDRVLQRRAAARIIQRKYKTHSSMMWLRKMRSNRVKGIAQLQRFYRRRIRGAQQRKLRINYQRVLLEGRESGQQQYEKSCIYAHIDAFWEGACKTRSINVPHDMQKYFQGSSSGGMVESSRFAKQMQNAAKECDLFGEPKKKGKKGGKNNNADGKDKPTTPSKPENTLPSSMGELPPEEEAPTIGTRLNSTMIEAMFLKVKALNDKRIDYECFLDLLCNLGAMRFLGLKDSVLPNGRQLKELTKIIKQVDEKEGSGSDGFLSDRERVYEYGVLVEDEVMTQQQIDMVLAINNFAYGRFTGRSALIAKFGMDYIALTPEYKKAAKELGKHASALLSEKLVTKSVSVLQVWARNRLAINRILHYWKQIAKRKINARRKKAAILIQNMIRVFLGRVHIMRMAQTIYSKFFDEETGAAYWFNPRTEAAFWTKPTLLGSKDCGNPVSMPPADEQYIVLCSLCDPDDNPSSATVFCDECDAVYCPNCYRIAHKSAKMAVHKTIVLTLCVQCDFQAAARSCTQCKDFYCDNCYKTTHDKGRLKLHIYETCTQECKKCATRAAQWVYTPNDGKNPETFYCIPCVRQTIGPEGDAPIREINTMMDVEGEPSLARYKFKGASVLKFRGDRDEALRKKELADDFARRKAEQYNQKQQRSATHIQRSFRGYKDRKDIVDFQEQRRKFFVLREQQMYLRNNLIYKFMAWWGVAPNMQSDTLLERVLNSYPAHMHHIIAECINNKWKAALILQREQDEHLKRVGNPSKLKTYFAILAANSQKKKFLAAEQLLASKIASLEAKKILYREARARSDAKKEHIAALQKSAEDTAHQAEKALEEKEKEEEAMRVSDQQVMDFIGPRGLQTMVNDRRKNGILMPFRVHMTQGSRIAQVTWETPPDYAAIALEKHAAEQAAELAAVEAAKEAAKTGKKGKNQPAAVVAPVEEESEEVLSHQEKRLRGFNDYLAAVDAHLLLRNPRREKDGTLIVDDDGKAVDGFGNILENDPETNEPVLHEPFEPLPLLNPRENNPHYGQWVKNLHEHDILLIQGGSFQIRNRADFIQEMKDTTRTAADDEADEKARKAAERAEDIAAGNDIEDEEEEDSSDDEANAAEEIDEDDIDYQDRKHRKIDLLIMDRYDSDDHICLDRPWVLQDAEFVSVCKVIPAKFYMKPIKSLQKTVVASYVPQKLIQINAITLHHIGKVNNLISRLFDEESDTGAWFKQNERNMNRRKWNIVKYSREVTHFTFDFTIRRKIWQAIARTAQNIKKGVKGILNRAKAASGDVDAGLDFNFWNASTTKTSIVLWYDLGLRGEEKLGTIEMDMTAPIYLLREYIYRSNEIRCVLNEKFQGENFLFFVVKDNENYDGVNGDSVEDWLCMRDAEKATFTSDFCPFKIDNKTMEGANRCTIVPDVMHPEHVKINKRDKNGMEILEPGDPGYEEWVKEQEKSKKSKNKKSTPPSSPTK